MYNLVSDQVIKLYKDTEGYMWGRRLTEGRPYKIVQGYGRLCTTSPQSGEVVKLHKLCVGSM